MNKNKMEIFKEFFYILLGMSLMGTFALIILNGELSKMPAGSYVDYVDFESLVDKVFHYVCIENILLYILCIISLIIIIRKKKVNIKSILIIVFSVLSSALVVNTVESIVGNTSNPADCVKNSNGSCVRRVDKPMLYVYPNDDMDLTVRLKNADLITHSYPKYNNEWNIHVTKNGNIYDYGTGRNYYALFWEGIDNSVYDTSYGFVVEGKNTAEFLEEKLSILGLNEKESNEFIVYWLPKMENNKYNYIRFRTDEEINNYMPIEFSANPDTLIRVYMDFKGLNEKLEIKEQTLFNKNREGYTVVEWGGRELI